MNTPRIEVKDGGTWLVEDYVEGTILRALSLQDQLEGSENRIATARTDYNQAVGQYNGYIRTFPQALTAKVTGARPRKYFEATTMVAVCDHDLGTSTPRCSKTFPAPASPGMTASRSSHSISS
jgi:LemA protein